MYSPTQVIHSGESLQRELTQVVRKTALCVQLQSCIHVFLTYVHTSPYDSLHTHTTPSLMLMLYMCWWESLTECAAMYVQHTLYVCVWLLGEGGLQYRVHCQIYIWRCFSLCVCAGVYISICITKHIAGMWQICLHTCTCCSVHVWSGLLDHPTTRSRHLPTCNSCAVFRAHTQRLDGPVQTNLVKTRLKGNLHNTYYIICL